MSADDQSKGIDALRRRTRWFAVFVVFAVLFVLVAAQLIHSIWTRSISRATLDVVGLVFCYWIAMGALGRCAPVDDAAPTQQ